VTTYESILAILVLPTKPKVVVFKVVTVLAVGSTIINYIVLIYHNYSSDYITRPYRSTTVDI
jgi:hypothetical protein